MTKQELLNKVRFHWHLYVARGGLSSPRVNLGKLQKGGIEHWSKFLQSGKLFVMDYPNDLADLDFIPPTMLLLLRGI